MSWGGVPLNARTAAMMDEAQALYGATITATQGSPSTGVSASVGTHNGEGVIDVVGADLDAIVIAMRQVGFAAWHRTSAQGFTPHVHGVAVGEVALSSAAAQQVAAYFDNRNGLANNGADDGPRTWVGVTWETYTGTPELPTGDRPTGAPFWGESLPLEDSSVLTGAPVYVTAADGSEVASDSAGFAATKIDTGSGNDSDDYVSCTTGDSIVWIISDTGTYLAGGEAPEFRWMIRARGTGSLAVYDDIDPDWNYSLPANSLGTVTVSAVDWTDYPVTTTTPTVSSILDGDGQRFAVVVTGAVDIVRICLALVPVGGAVGGFGDLVPSDDAEVIADPHTRGLATGFDDHTNNPFAPAAVWGAAWGQAAGDLAAGEVGTTTNSLTLGAFYQAVKFAESEESVVGWQLTAGVVAINLGLGSMSPFPDGTEGIDFIRRPDRTAYDDDAYSRWDGAPAVASWENNVYSFDATDDDLGGSWYLRKMNFKPLQGFGTTIMPDLVTAPVLATGSAAGSGAGGLGLTSSDTAFNLSFMSSFATDGAGSDPMTDISYVGQFRIFLGEADFSADPETWLPLTAHISVPDYQLWKPGLYGDRPDDPDGGGTVTVTWLRQRQRNDGLGNSVIRARGSSSRQMSLRQRGYR